MPVQGRKTIIYRKDIIFHEGKTIADLNLKPNFVPEVSKSDQIWGPSVEVPPPIENRAEAENILRRSLRINPPNSQQPMCKISDIERDIQYNSDTIRRVPSTACKFGSNL